MKKNTNHQYTTNKHHHDQLVQVVVVADRWGS